MGQLESLKRIRKSGELENSYKRNLPFQTRWKDSDKEKGTRADQISLSTKWDRRLYR